MTVLEALPDIDAWRSDPIAFADVWQHDEAPSYSNPDWPEDWREICHSINGDETPNWCCRPMMTNEELATYDALPEFVTVWRGISLPVEEDPRKIIERGMSWTLNRERAAWFARRFLGTVGFDDRLRSKAYVAQAAVHKSAIYACFNGREEAEVVIDPECIEIDRIDEIFGREVA